jgi:hypothetical protein
VRGRFQVRDCTGDVITFNGIFPTDIGHAVFRMILQNIAKQGFGYEIFPAPTKT